MKMWNVMLVDRDRLFAAALGTLIGGGPFRIVHHAATPADAVSSIAAGNDPDLVILAMPGGTEDAEGLKRLRPLTEGRLVVLADEADDRLLTMALRNGADACLHKGMSSESLLRALHLVALGEVVYPTHVAALLLAGTNGRPFPSIRASPAGGALSKREIQILRCLLAGQSNKAIARHLQITESTVKMHFKNVMRKIAAENRTQAAVWAIQNGLAPMANV